MSHTPYNDLSMSRIDDWNDDYDITMQATSNSRKKRPSLAPVQRDSFASTFACESAASSRCSSYMNACETADSFSTVSSEGVPTRPSSSMGWEYEGAWDVGRLEDKDDCSGRVKVLEDEWLDDPAEMDLRNRPFLIARYVAEQLRADVLDDFSQWPSNPKQFTPEINPEHSNAPLLPSKKTYSNLVAALGLASPVPHPPMSASTKIFPALRHSAPATGAAVPSIMVTAPSSDPPSPVFRYNSGGYAMAADSLMIQWCARRTQPRQSWPLQLTSSFSQEERDSLQQTVDEDEDENVALSDVKRALEMRQSRHGLRSRMLSFLRRRG